MKLLMIYCHQFGYNPAHKTLDIADADVAPAAFQNVQTAFIQAEAEDADNAKAVENKLLKNLKWVCGKNDTKRVILHSFSHLSDSKADPAFTLEILNKVEERLKSSGFEVWQTPFGYFLDLKMDAPGFSLARVFKSF